MTFQSPKTVTELEQENADLQMVNNNLIARNQQLMEHLYKMDNPERTLLVVCHEEDKEDKWADVLANLYQAGLNNRLAISEVRDSKGNQFFALCGVQDIDGEGEISLYPLFRIDDVPANETWSFPAPDNKWVEPGSDAVEAKIALS